MPPSPSLVAPAPVAGTDATPALLLYDGACGVCAGSVQFLLARERPERRAALRFAPLGGPTAAAIIGHHPWLARVDSVVWVEPSAGAPRVRVRSDAALAALAHLGGGWAMLAAIGRLVPRPLRDAVYAVVARHRLSLAAPRCLLPDAATRDRFLA